MIRSAIEMASLIAASSIGEGPIPVRQLSGSQNRCRDQQDTFATLVHGNQTSNVTHAVRYVEVYQFRFLFVTGMRGLSAAAGLGPQQERARCWLQRFGGLQNPSGGIDSRYGIIAAELMHGMHQGYWIVGAASSSSSPHSGCFGLPFSSSPCFSHA